MERWSGRVALVTGASEGIGAAIARHLATLGMRVVGVARSHHKIKEWSVGLPSGSGEVHALQCDVTKEDQVHASVTWARENLGGIDVLVNNAGVVPVTNIYDAPTENMQSMLDVNILGLSMFTRDVVADMRDRGIDDGHIFHINRHPWLSFLRCHQTRSKGYVMTEGLRRELRDLKTKIRVTSISPGLVRTNIFMNNGFGEENTSQIFNECPAHEPHDIAAALEYALATPSHVQVHEITVMPTGNTY